MHHENNRYYELAEKWLNGTLSKEEEIEFSEWYNKKEDTILNIPEKFAGSEEELRKRILSKIRKRQKKKERIFYMDGRTWVRWAAASAIVLIGTISFFYFLSTPDKVTIAETLPPKDTVIPGGNKAILVLGDGTRLVLDSANSGTIAEDDHVKVIKLNDGQLAYSPVNEKNTAVTYNTLSTPRGGQYSITLADGTKAWLNSASSLRFPSLFKEVDRIVELTGEGYFEVSANHEKPFKVKVNDIEVKVLGTHFNIMAYKDELSVNTSLLEGSVEIRKQNKSTILKPGQQAQVNQDGKIGIIKNADMEQAIAWKNGVFNFNGSDIETTMRQIARWYDIEIVYKEKITEHFNGTIVRNTSIGRVLQMLEFTGVVRFKREGRKVFVHSEGSR